MITTSNSLCRERDAQSCGRRPTSCHGRFRAFPRSNRIQPTANIANCCATSSTTERQVFWPWPLWQFFFLGASSGAYPVSHELPPGGSGERAETYINQGYGLSPLPHRNATTPNYSLNHARSGSDSL